MLKITSPVPQNYAPPTQTPSYVTAAIQYDPRTERCGVMLTLLDQNKNPISPDKRSLPQQPPTPTPTQLAEIIAIIGPAIDAAVIPLVKAIFGLAATAA